MFIKNMFRLQKLNNLINFKSIIRNQSGFCEVRVPVPWGHIAGKWWGPLDKRPILTIHGWQDNCGSFNRLIPLLNQKDVGFLAIDLPGNGFSSPFPPGMYYHFASLVISIQYIVKYFEWKKVSLMAHSLGTILSFLYATTFPKKVDLMLQIDALKPLIYADKLERVTFSIEKFIEYDSLFSVTGNEPPSYTMDEIKRRIHEPNEKSVDLDMCHHIAERGVKPSAKNPDRFYFTRDPRWKLDDLTMWNLEELAKAATRITAPVFVAKSSRGSYFDKAEYFYRVLDALKENSLECALYRFEGTHHFHMNQPEELAKALNQFIAKYNNVEERSCVTEKTKIVYA